MLKAINKKDEVIFVGGGGHARSIAEGTDVKIKGYIDTHLHKNFNAEWLGKDSDAEKWIQEGYPIHIAFVYNGLPVMANRKELIERYKALNASFATLISPTAIVTPNSTIGAGSAILNGAIVNLAEIGENVVVNSGAIVEHDCKIGDNTFIGPGAVIGGATEIGCDCFIGLGARLKNGIKIGDGISIAMGAIVDKKLVEPGIYHGNPLKRFKIKIS